MYSNYLFAFDVDGTLRTTDTHIVPPGTILALKQLKAQGYKIVISSGRGVDSLKTTGVIELVEWDGYICNNGQIILDHNQQVLFSKHMDPDAVKAVIKKADELGYAVTCKSNPRFITKEPDENVLRAQRYFGNSIPKVGTYIDQPIDALNVFGPVGYDYHDFEGIEGINILPGESSYSDFTIAGVSKATAIDFLKKHLHVSKCVAFGDSLNDVEMFECADISVAMGQGNARLLEMATFVTRSTEDEGILHACKTLGFIK